MSGISVNSVVAMSRNSKLGKENKNQEGKSPMYVCLRSKRLNDLD